MNKVALIVIAKEPLPGRAKTRLTPPCTSAEAATLWQSGPQTSNRCRSQAYRGVAPGRALRAAIGAPHRPQVNRPFSRVGARPLAGTPTPGDPDGKGDVCVVARTLPRR